MRLTIGDVLAAIAPAQLFGAAAESLVFTSVAYDSRLVEPGALFVALQGERDGHVFIPDAYRRGAAGVLATRPVDVGSAPNGRRKLAFILVDNPLAALQRLSHWWRRQLPSLAVTGITGNVGKTTAKEVIAHVLGTHWCVLKSEGNLNNEIGLPLSLLRLEPTHERAVLEMGTYAIGEIALLCSLAEPRDGIVMNVGPTHLERFGTIERIAEAKGELPAALPADGYCILNGDDPLVRSMADRTAAAVLSFGLGEANDLSARAIEGRGLDGIAFTACYHGAQVPVVTPLLGRHSIYPCLAAVGAALAAGLDFAEACAALATVENRLRLNVVAGPNGSRIVDDSYNANPASTHAALDLLADIPAGRRIAVLGDMLELGSFEEEGHRGVGRHAAQRVDRLFAVGPRARWIAAEARQAGLDAVEEFDRALDVELVDLRPGDVVLIKGSRGMKMEDLVKKIGVDSRSRE